MRAHRLLFMLSAALGIASWAAGASAAPEPMKLEGSDRDFVLAAAMGSHGEVKLGQLAVERAESADVKRFARRMIEDHTQAGIDLGSLAKEKGIALSTDVVGAEQKAAMAKLVALTGAAFDKAYIAQMVEDHAKHIAAFEKQIASGKDPVVRAWASKTLPALRAHLRLARRVASRIGAPDAPVK